MLSTRLQSTSFMRVFRLSIWLATSCTMLVSMPQAVASLPSLPEAADAPNVPKNLVIMIGDGMGPAYTSAYRYYNNNPQTEEIEQTVFDRLLVGSASTYPARVSGYVTDSAASATALATGIKTYNGAISVDTDEQPITTIMALAKQRGLAIGIVVTSQINHATPAAFLSHNVSRKNYDELANSYLDVDADVLFGGGQKYFPPALIKQFEQLGYRYLSDFSKLDSVTEPKVIGLFADVQLPWAIDEPGANKLSQLTRKALELLSQNEQGFILLVEGSLIDWAGHDNDIATAMSEMNEFANAIEVVEQYVRDHRDTLMVVTADHNTGGLSIGARGDYRWSADIIRAVSASPATIATIAIAADNWQQGLKASLGFDLSDAELTQLSKAHMQGQEVLHSAIKSIIDIRSNTGWTTGGHTGVDVQVFAYGPAAELFNGHQDNTDIATKLFSLLPKSTASQSSEPTAAIIPAALKPAELKSTGLESTVLKSTALTPIESKA